MWRSYYEQRYAALLVDLYALNRDEYDFSPADSLAIAWYAARAAQTFQPTRSRAEAQKALPMLTQCYAGAAGKRLTRARRRGSSSTGGSCAATTRNRSSTDP